MSSLFGAAAYGYVFKGDKSLEFREWIENPLNKDDYFKYRLNEGHSWNKGKLCIDYESNVTFSLMQIEHKVLLISIPIGADLNVSSFFVCCLKFFDI